MSHAFKLCELDGSICCRKCGVLASECTTRHCRAANRYLEWICGFFGFLTTLTDVFFGLLLCVNTVIMAVIFKHLRTMVGEFIDLQARFDLMEGPAFDDIDQHIQPEHWHQYIYDCPSEGFNGLFSDFGLFIDYALLFVCSSLAVYFILALW